MEAVIVNPQISKQFGIENPLIRLQVQPNFLMEMTEDISFDFGVEVVKSKCVEKGKLAEKDELVQFVLFYFYVHELEAVFCIPLPDDLIESFVNHGSLCFIMADQNHNGMSWEIELPEKILGTLRSNRNIFKNTDLLFSCLSDYLKKPLESRWQNVKKSGVNC